MNPILNKMGANANEQKKLWRANLCATFLGNLVYPTPASKRLHFP